jgi:hypothetical protein
MALPIVNNNNGVAISANGTYCTSTVPGWINLAGLVQQPQFGAASYYIGAGSTGAGTVVTFQAQNNDSSWSNLSSPAPITLANSTVYNGSITGPVGSIQIVVSSLVGNGINYCQLAGVPLFRVHS